MNSNATEQPVSVIEQHKSKIELNYNELFNKGLCVGAKDTSSLTQQFREIKRTVIDFAFDRNDSEKAKNNLVMVTSPNKGEGKTFFSVNLALSIALEQNTTVLLVDANINNPSLESVLGFKANRGLMDYLLGEEESIADFMCNTSLDNLKIIPAGKNNFLATEYLASERMALLAKELSERYLDRLVIFDSPELLGVTETHVLASLMGQTLIVAESGKTSIESLQQAQKYLSPDVKIGVVINKVLS
jgi:protein-tyrosine kinase